MSKYVEQMKDTLVSFNNTANEINERVAEDRLQALQNAAEGAKNQIREILQNALGAAHAWAALDPTEIDHDDLLLLQGAFHVSITDIRRLVVKHQNNGTMINAISKYISAGFYHNPVKPAELCYVPKLEDKIRAYKHFADYANSVIENIKNGTQAAGDELQHWADPETIGEQLTAIVYGIN